MAKTNPHTKQEGVPKGDRKCSVSVVLLGQQYQGAQQAKPMRQGPYRQRKFSLGLQPNELDLRQSA